MKSATTVRSDSSNNRLMVINPLHRSIQNTYLNQLPTYFKENDLIVVNDAATLPASLKAITEQGEKLEVRLVCSLSRQKFSVVLFGEGNWKTRTEDRPPPPVLANGTLVFIESSILVGRVAWVSPISPRWVELEFNLSDTEILNQIYQAGIPIQYSYMNRNLELWDIQTPYATRPWGVEMPSAGKPLRWKILIEILKRKVNIATVTHSTGISSTGDPIIDSLLPLPEKYEIPLVTIDAIGHTKKNGGRVIAIGTSVTRALEGNFISHGRSTAKLGVTDLKIKADFKRRVVDGIFSGIHDSSESHYELLAAFMDQALLKQAVLEAESQGYLNHEFGDSCLVLN